MDGSSFTKTYPVVLRFESMWPAQLAGYELHRTREGGDVGHVDKTKSGRNRLLIGDEDWAQEALKEINAIRAENYAAELEALDKQNRRKQLEKRIAEGPRDPWRGKKHGPLREVILTANAEYFDSDPNNVFGEEGNITIELFEQRAIDWLRREFGDDVIHARADLDERAYHIHAIIMPRATVEMTRTNKNTGEKRVIATRKMLQPAKFDVLRYYELAQDSVGAFFGDLGLKRGERRKQAFREAIARGEEPPKKRQHVRPRDYREAQERALAQREKDLADQAKALSTEQDVLADGQRALATREQEADAKAREAEAVLAVADAVAVGEIDLDGESDDALAAPPNDPSDRRSHLLDRLTASPAAARALSAFQAAFAKMRGRAEEKARKTAIDDLATLRGRIAEATAQIGDAAGLLPEDRGGRLKTLHETLTKGLRKIGFGIARERNEDHRSASDAKKNPTITGD